jgi:nitroreductase
MEMMMDVSEAIRTRHAVRQFKPEPVPEDVMLTILNAGRRSQSSKNTQPWQFIVVRDRDMLKRLSGLGDFAGHLAGAAFAVGLVGEKETHWNSFDLGQAASLLQIAAWEQGVGSCIAAIYQQDEAKKLLGIPQEKNFYCMISFGYEAEEHKPAQMGGRRPIEEVVRWEKWDGGKP